jgi:hypothetical protein
MIVERFIAIAPTLMGRLTRHRINIPAAAEMAITFRNLAVATISRDPQSLQAEVAMEAEIRPQRQEVA